MIQIRPDMRGARAYLNKLEKRELPRVIGRALDRTASSIKSRFSTTIRQRLALKKAVVDAAIKTRRSGDVSSITAMSLGRAWFEISVSGKPIPLRDWNARLTKKGVTFQVARAKGRRRYTALGQPGFVVARFGNNVFVRKGPEPPGPGTVGIRKVYGPSLPQFLQSRAQRIALIAHAKDFWARELIRNAQFVLRKRGAL